MRRRTDVGAEKETVATCEVTHDHKDAVEKLDNDMKDEGLM